MSDLILKPETVVHAEKQKEKQRQLERRGIAREMLPAIIEVQSGGCEADVKVALQYADELLAKTKVDE